MPRRSTDPRIHAMNTWNLSSLSINRVHRYPFLIPFLSKLHSYRTDHRVRCAAVDQIEERYTIVAP